MAINSHKSSLLHATSIAIIMALLVLSPPTATATGAASYHHKFPPPVHPVSTWGMSSSALEDKSRLGSRPPSCHSRCNGCHPCMADQVPSEPSHRPVRPGRLSRGAGLHTEYANYKPLGWKCRCGNHFYNP